MALTLVGGSNFAGRFLLRNVAGKYKTIQLADFYPFRPAVYNLQEELGLDLEKNAMTWRTNFLHAVDGADEVVVISHDYFKLAHSKNMIMQRLANYAKNAGVKKFTWVNPVEFTQLDSFDGDPIQLVKDAEAAAREAFPTMAVLHTSLLFGENCTSLILKHALEHLSAGGSVIGGNNGQTKFAPVHESDFLAAFNDLKPGDTKTLVGPETMTYAQIIDTLAKHCGKAPQSIGSGGLFGKIATCKWIGDAFFPSQVQQLFRLAKKEIPLTGNVTGKVKLSEHYKEGGFSGSPSLNWHEIAVD
jgi:uncharacterized protein YbjT (DUF2867 family)